MNRLLITAATAALLSTSAFAAGGTAKTAALAEAANASGTGDASQAIITPPAAYGVPTYPVPAAYGTVIVPATLAPAAGTPATATVILPATSADVLVAVPASPLGATLASKIKNPETSEFRDALARTNITQPFDPEKGFTIFAVVNNDYNDRSEEPTYYVANEVISLTAMAGASDRFDTLTGDDVRANRMGTSYYVNDKRVNAVEHVPGGIVYTIGGSVAANLGTPNKPGV